MYKKTAPDDHSHIREQIGQQLKAYYQACATDELPTRLREVLKQLDEQRPELSGEEN